MCFTCLKSGDSTITVNYVTFSCLRKGDNKWLPISSSFTLTCTFISKKRNFFSHVSASCSVSCKLFDWSLDRITVFRAPQNSSCVGSQRLSKNSINFPWYLIPFLYLAVNTQSFLPQHPFFSHALYKLLIDFACEKLSVDTNVCARCPHVGTWL